jgi:hypothetical protein
MPFKMQVSPREALRLADHVGIECSIAMRLQRMIARGSRYRRGLSRRPTVHGRSHYLHRQS